MESLAILAVFLISLTVLGGPISLVLTFLPKRLLSLVVIKILTCAIALLAIVVGIMLIINVNSIGALIMGVIGIATGIIAIYRVIKVIPKL
ncbi:MAG: hypothetical protein JHD34_05340 [Candidatus Nanopelagicus sp.]|jgi:hypothetical protein|nr:hypothetical protein [Candidatus Nanopelagicus sp.]